MTVMRQRGRAKRRVLMVLAGVLGLFLASGAAGYAWWQVQGNTTIDVRAGSLASPTLSCKNIKDGGIRLDWESNNPKGSIEKFVVDIIMSNKHAENDYPASKPWESDPGNHSFVHSGKIDVDLRNTLLQDTKEPDWEVKFRLKAYRGEWFSFDLAYGWVDEDLSDFSCY